MGKTPTKGRMGLVEEAFGFSQHYFNFLFGGTYVPFVFLLLDIPEGGWSGFLFFLCLFVCFSKHLSKKSCFTHSLME